ncbi:MAG: competence protein ComEC [Solirubrobacteraceae bacterium]|nr:competence protein ComEC [Solirubrobacteraceae bacterium]
MMRPVIVALVALFLAAVPAHAATAPCIPGDGSSPACQWWNAKVTLVADGDTIDVKIPGEGAASVRFIGINAMELSKYSHTASARRGDCMGVPAANFAERMIKASGWKVRLASQSASSRSGRRIRRSVFVKSGGRWVDLGKAELAAGYDLFLPNGDEFAHNLEYEKVAQEAQAAGKNLWNPNACGGPDQSAPLSVVANWDADGADEQNLNGEYIEIRNSGGSPVDIGGWWARDSWLNWFQDKQHGTPGFRFAPGTTVPARGLVRLHVGCGGDDGTDIHWCQKSSAFENVSYDQTNIGDGAYLFDPKGDLRAAFQYPCRVACQDPAQGNVKVVPVPATDLIAVVNTTLQPLDISDQVIKLRNHGTVGEYVFGHVFNPGSILPGLGFINFVSQVGSGLSNNGGVVELRTLDDQLTACADWGFGHC